MAIRSPGSGRTKRERTVNRLIGTVSAGRRSGVSAPPELFGMRYAFAIQYPSNARVSTVTLHRAFYPVGCIPAGDDEAKGESIQHRSDSRSSPRRRSRQAHAPDPPPATSPYPDRGKRRLIQAVERDVDGGGANAGRIQQIAKADAGPERVSHSPVLPLRARHTRREQAARVA